MMNGNTSSQCSPTSPSFVTANKQDEPPSRWAPAEEIFLNMEEECTSGMRRTSSRGISQNIKLSDKNNRIPSPLFKESCFRSRGPFQLLFGSNQISLRKKKNGRKNRTKVMILFIILLIVVSVFMNDSFGQHPSSILANTMSLEDITGAIHNQAANNMFLGNRQSSQTQMQGQQMQMGQVGQSNDVASLQQQIAQLQRQLEQQQQIQNQNQGMGKTGAMEIPPAIIKPTLNISDTIAKSIYPKPPLCTTAQLLKVRHQIPPETCAHQNIQRIAYQQVCSLTTATKCPNATWLEDFYLEKQRKHSELLLDRQDKKEVIPPFLGISIGCNKGFDAINTLRMGIYDSEIDKVKWKDSMTDNGTSAMHFSVCNQDSPTDMFPILVDTGKSRPLGEMHCIEPMPQTYRQLKHSAETLGYTDKGFVVTHGAVSKSSGEIPFRTGGELVGVENVGLAASCNRGLCEMVKVYSLLDFVETKVEAPKEQNINVLSIDVEGFDGDVLLGATAKVLERVEYLEFEYNWMGSWKHQHLYDIVELLDQQGHMVCYWAGRDRLWRITECWMSYYDVHSWSNVACANRELVPELVAKMEATFQRTLKDDTQWVKEHQTEKKLEYFRTKYKNNTILSLDEAQLRKKYIKQK